MRFCKLRRRIGGNKGDRSARRVLQSGQSMVLVVLLMIAFIALLAVILDGGYAYFQKRNAQTAADAGAMAGARELCFSGNVAMANQVAQDYAIARNQALLAIVGITGGEVEVTAQIPFATFFGTVLGRPSITSSAVAAANCFPPSTGAGVLPIAWHCPPYLTEIDLVTGVKYCDVDMFDDIQTPDPPIEQRYIIMNSRKTGDEAEDPFCQRDGGPVLCDIDGDGDDELLVGGNRSWLDLSGGGGGASELIDWIENGFSPQVQYHTWYAGQGGVATSVFMAVEDYQLRQKVVLPVYDAIAKGSPPLLHSEDTIVWTSGASTTYYHVISFSIFYPLCVHLSGGDKDCDLYNHFRSTGALGPDEKTIEGYFIKGTAIGLGGRGELDAGAFTLYLTR